MLEYKKKQFSECVPLKTIPYSKQNNQKQRIQHFYASIEARIPEVCFLFPEHCLNLKFCAHTSNSFHSKIGINIALDLIIVYCRN